MVLTKFRRELMFCLKFLSEIIFFSVFEHFHVLKGSLQICLEDEHGVKGVLFLPSGDTQIILLSYRSENTFAHLCGRGKGRHWQKPAFGSGISSERKGMGAIVWNTESETDEQMEKQG